MIDEQKLRELADQFICHPVSRSITEVEQGGEAIKELLDELATLRKERTAWRVRAENAEKDAARYRWLRRCRGQEHDPLFTVQHELDGTLWGGDLDAAIDAMKETP